MANTPIQYSTYGKYINLQNMSGSNPSIEDELGAIFLSGTVGSEVIRTHATASLSGLTFNSGSGATVKVILDEDAMGSNSAVALATQQSIKAYVDAQVTGADLDFQGDSGGALSIDLDSETLTIAGGGGLSTTGSSNTLTIQVDVGTATASTTIADGDLLLVQDGNDTRSMTRANFLGSAAAALSNGMTTTTIVASGIVKTDDTTEATTTTDGSLQTDGGLSVAKSAVIGDDLDLLSDSAIFSMGAGKDATFTHDGTTGLTIAATPVTVNSTGKLTFDASENIVLDSDATGSVVFKDGGTEFGRIYTDAGNKSLVMSSSVSDADISFKGNDGGTQITALTLDMSEAGAATFNGPITCATSLTIGSAAMSEADLEQLDGITAGTSAASKAMVTDADGDILMPDGDKFELGASSDMQLYHDGTNSFIANKTGALKVATETSGIAVTIGHSTSEVTVADNLTVAGNLTVTGTTITDSVEVISTSSGVLFEGGTDDGHEGTLISAVAGADVTYTLPNLTGHIPLLAGAASNANVTAAEFHLLDGGSSVATVTVADGDGVLFNDAGTMKQVTVQSLAAYFDDEITAMPNLVTVGTIGSGVWNAGAVTSSGRIVSDSSTEATSTTDGSIQTDGGISAAKSIVCGDDLDLLSDGAILNFGADKDVTLTHAHNDGLLLNSSKELQFGDGDTFICQSSDGVLKLEADGQIDMEVGSSGVIIKGTTPKVTIGDAGAEDTFLVFDGNAQDYRIGLDDGTDKLEIGVGATHGTTTAITVDASQQVAIVATTAASSTTSGALTVAGGASVAADLYVGDDLELDSDDAKLGFGADSDVSLTHKHNEGLLLNSTMKLFFEDDDNDDQYIGSAGSGVTAVAAPTEIDLTAPTLDLNAATAVLMTTPSLVIDSSTSEKPVVEIKNSNADAEAAVLRFNHDSASPADNDSLGMLEFYGDDDGGNSTEYAAISGMSLDVTDGTEDGAVTVECMVGGTLREVAQFWDGTNGLVLPNNSSYGTAKAHSFVTYSDEALKKNIETLSNPVDKIMSLRGVSYEWKSDGTNDIGFIAQEVNKVVPEVVYGKTENGGLGIDYARLTTLLVEAVKTQQVEISTLKDAISQLKK